MKIAHLHGWHIANIDDAIQLQKRLAEKVIDDVPLPINTIRTVAGADVSVRHDQSTAAVVVLSFPDMQVIETAHAQAPVTFPYIPGLLSFRETPVLLSAFEQLHTVPDVVMVDGMGQIHPRRFGIACHLGLWLNLPTVGVGKTPFIGTYDVVPPEKGAKSPIYYKNEMVGVALRTRERAKSLYVSVGHKMDLDSAIAVVMACVGKYKQPEPIRHAHNAAGKNDGG